MHYAKRNPKSKPGYRSDQGLSESDAGLADKVHGVADHPGGAAGGLYAGGARPKTVNLQVPSSNVPLRNMFDLLSQLGTPTL